MEECCKNERKNSFLSGITYGLIPHIGCISFIIFTILGATAASAFLKPMMLNSYFFYGLIALSFVFATIGAIFYLRKYGMLSLSGVSKKKGYLATMYGTTILLNVLMFTVIFPYAANISSPTGMTISGSTITLEVQIPCSGHATLITDELNKLDGVIDVKFRMPNLFDVNYDKTKISSSDITNIDVFKTYNAKVL